MNSCFLNKIFFSTSQDQDPYSDFVRDPDLENMTTDPKHILTYNDYAGMVFPLKNKKK